MSEDRRPTHPTQVRKRDGTRVPFDAGRIEAAVARAQEAVGDPDPALPREVADLCCLTLTARAGLRPDADGVLPPAPRSDPLLSDHERSLAQSASCFSMRPWVTSINLTPANTEAQ